MHTITYSLIENGVRDQYRTLLISRSYLLALPPVLRENEQISLTQIDLLVKEYSALNKITSFV